MAKFSIVGVDSRKAYDSDTIKGRVKVRFYPEILHAEFSIDGSSWITGSMEDNYLTPRCFSLNELILLEDEFARMKIFVNPNSDTDKDVLDCLVKSGIEAEIILLEEEHGKKE